MNRHSRTLLVSLLLLVFCNLVGLQAACASSGPEHCEHDGPAEQQTPHEICPGDICHALISLLAKKWPDHPVTAPTLDAVILDGQVPAPRINLEIRAIDPSASRPPGTLPLLI